MEIGIILTDGTIVFPSAINRVGTGQSSGIELYCGRYKSFYITYGDEDRIRAILQDIRQTIVEGIRIYDLPRGLC